MHVLITVIVVIDLFTSTVTHSSWGGDEGFLIKALNIEKWSDYRGRLNREAIFIGDYTMYVYLHCHVKQKTRTSVNE